MKFRRILTDFDIHTSVIYNLFEFQITNYIILLQINPTSSLMPFPVLLWHVSMHCWKASSDGLLLMAFTPSKQVLLMIPLRLGKNSYGARSGEWGGCSSWWYSSWAVPAREDVMSRCIVAMRQSQVVMPQLSSFLAHWTKHTRQNLLVDLLIDHLAL